MEFKSSQISFVSLSQRTVLASHQSPSLPASINAVVSRVASLLLSPSAALDLAFHTAVLPVTLLYSVGKSVVKCEANFTLPWQHLQRIREAVFPLLFGTAFGLIHPFAGIYMTEPRDKHIAGGILLSHSKAQTNVCVSPISAFEEIQSIMSDNPKEKRLPEDYLQHVKSILSWERPLEMVQALELFDLKLTANGMSAIYSIIDQTGVSEHLIGILKRVSLIAYPILASLDTMVNIASSLFLLGTGIVQLTGAKTPCYLETTVSPVLHVYSIARIIVGLFSAFAGFGISLFNPEKGLDYSFTSSRKLHMVKALTFPIFKRLEREVGALKQGERMVLPVAKEQGEKKDILPSRSSHMTYLLIEKQDDRYSAEYIDRNEKHGAAKQLTKAQVCQIGRNCLKLRYASMNRGMTSYITNTFTDKNDLAELGNQRNLTNCVITNLFAVFDVLNHHDGGNEPDHQKKIKSFRALSLDRYDHFQYDFFPFAPMEAIVNEVLTLKKEKI